MTRPGPLRILIDHGTPMPSPWICIASSHTDMLPPKGCAAASACGPARGTVNLSRFRASLDPKVGIVLYMDHEVDPKVELGACSCRQNRAEVESTFVLIR